MDRRLNRTISAYTGSIKISCRFVTAYFIIDGRSLLALPSNKSSQEGYSQKYCITIMTLKPLDTSAMMRRSVASDVIICGIKLIMTVSFMLVHVTCVNLTGSQRWDWVYIRLGHQCNVFIWISLVTFPKWKRLPICFGTTRPVPEICGVSAFARTECRDYRQDCGWSVYLKGRLSNFTRIKRSSLTETCSGHCASCWK